MASVDRSVSGQLRSGDLLHAGLAVALLLGESVSLALSEHCTYMLPCLVSLCIPQNV